MSGPAESWHDQGSWSDQEASEADQTLSDSDQTASDSDQSGSDGDQAAAQSDQVLSDRDQAAADREFDAGPFSDPDRLRAYEEAQAERGAGTLARATAGTARAQIAAERDVRANRRDEIARRRDEIAAARDVAATLADRRAATAASDLMDLDPRTETAFAAAAVAREKAASARMRAAADRRHAARDREAAALDRAHLQTELRRSQFDDLTGALRRGIGEVLVGGEIERAWRDGGRLQVAFIDVDGLKGINDTLGHAAGDGALRCVYAGFRVRLRPYDPIIRWGGDEFVCLMPGVDADDARGRIEATRADLARLDPQVFVSFGLAGLRADDTVTTLIARADQALFDSRDGRWSGDDADPGLA
jgi:diguanylate cyclase (GGDEF)-like protein